MRLASGQSKALKVSVLTTEKGVCVVISMGVFACSSVGHDIRSRQMRFMRNVSLRTLGDSRLTLLPLNFSDECIARVDHLP